MTTQTECGFVKLHVGSDGAWIELSCKSGSSFCFQPIQEFGADSVWRPKVVDWARDVQRHFAPKLYKPDIAGVCTFCGGFVMHRNGRPGEFDHICDKKKYDSELRADITLSSGRVVKHSRMKNGATDARISDSETGEMTQSEWEEYCQLIAPNKTV